MSINIDSMEQLIAELQKLTLAAMQEVSGVAVEKVKEELKTQVYDKNTPQRYKRTGDLMRSVTDEIIFDGKLITAKIYHNPNIMKAVAPYSGNNYMGQHYSSSPSYNPQDYRAYVAQTVNDGTSGHRFGIGFWTKARPYFTTAERAILSKFSSNLKSALKRQGLNAK